MINNFIILLTIHCLADYPLQGDFLANFKSKNFFLLMVHAFIWSGLVYSGAMFLGITNDPAWFIYLFLGHAAIDDWKCKRVDKSKALTTDLYIDQLGHFIQILVMLLVCHFNAR